MSFFSDNKKVGLALMIVGIISIAGGVVGVATASFDSKDLLTSIVGIFGTLIFGVLIVAFGLKTYSGPNDQVRILSGLINVIAVATILSAVFNGAYFYMVNDVTLIGAIASIAIMVVIGLVLLWIASQIAGSNKGTLSKVLWIVLVSAFLILSVLALVIFVKACYDHLWLLSCIILCELFVFIYAVFACLSPEVRAAMGV
jgi:hypothetical protein